MNNGFLACAVRANHKQFLLTSDHMAATFADLDITSSTTSLLLEIDPSQ